jgi:hypothetical protein
MHLKNLSLLCGEDGSYALAPAYDQRRGSEVAWNRNIAVLEAHATASKRHEFH